MQHLQNLRWCGGLTFTPPPYSVDYNLFLRKGKKTLDQLADHHCQVENKFPDHMNRQNIGKPIHC